MSEPTLAEQILYWSSLDQGPEFISLERKYLLRIARHCRALEERSAQVEALAYAVGQCGHGEVPEAVSKAWKDSPFYRAYKHRVEDEESVS